MPNHEHVAVLDDVLFAFQTQQPLISHAGIAIIVDQRLPVDHFRADELLLEVAMNRAGGLLSRAVHGNGPGANFGFAGGQEAHQAQ